MPLHHPRSTDSDTCLLGVFLNVPLQNMHRVLQNTLDYFMSSYKLDGINHFCLNKPKSLNDYFEC